MPDAMMRMWLQYTHLEKLYGYLPGLADAIPAIFGMAPAAYADVRAEFDAQARLAATQLLGDDNLAARVNALPFQPGEVVLAVGDSITDDLQSWVEILRHVLDLGRPGHDVRVINGGLSGHTTAMVARRWPATLAQHRPNWILCALGGNDVTRVGPEPTKPQVSLTECVANLGELRRIAAARSSASWVWITPVPVVEERVADFPAFRFGESTWRNADIRALTEAIRGFDDGPDDDRIVDLTEVFGMPADPDLQGPDGLHVSLAGQAAITTAVINRLAPVGAQPSAGGVLRHP